MIRVRALGARPQAHHHQQLIQALTPRLDAIGRWRWVEGDFDALLLLTGGTEVAATALLARHPAPHLIAHQSENALAAALELVAWHHQRGRAVRLTTLEEGRTELLPPPPELRAARGAELLAGVRLGVVGEPSPWLVASAPAASLLLDRWGVTVVPLPLSSLSPSAPALAPALERATQWRHLAEAVQEPSHPAMVGAAGVSLALDALVSEHQLDAITTGCFALVEATGHTACLALSHALDRGVVAGCEGDLLSTLTMLWAQRVTGQTPWMANPQTLRGEVLELAHCTVARSLTTSHTLRSHHETDKSAAIAGQLREGPVTLLRLGGGALDQLRVVEGELRPQPTREGRCRTQAEVRLIGGAEALLRQPLGNHLTLIYGHWRAPLLEVHREAFPTREG
ncbi:MAG: hypothetical protein JXX28_15755 [Deltaproteobacteria bacterium]|nr:hypothetical protein [Deltaproteobacteria bacterium]